ncbi:MAG: methyltransferase domain-containing protein [Spirochaetales bacterium]|nr:methyltransferase domain-containing protein [Spirochaetales bacterium]
MKKIGLFLQVRLNSTRMPGKALLDLHGKPLIVQVMERLMVVPASVRAVLTSEESLPLIKPLAQSMGWETYAGSTQNVLKRFAEAAMYYDVDIVIRATGDNPLLSSEIALDTLGLFNKKKCDLAYLAPIPYGSGVEVMSKDALLSAYKNATTPYQMEHVTPYIYQNKDKFKIECDRPNDDEIARSDVRITIDTREDYEKVNYMFRDMAKNFTNVHIRSVITEWDSVNFQKFRRLLFVIDSNDTNYILKFLTNAQILKKEFNIFVTVKDISYSMIDTFRNFDFKYIDYTLLEEHLSKNGAFDRVIIVGSKWDNNDYALLKKTGPIVGINNNEGLSDEIDIALYDTTVKYKEEDTRRYNYKIDKTYENIAKKTSKIVYETPKTVTVCIGEPDFTTYGRIISVALSELGYKVNLITEPNFKDTNNMFAACRLTSDRQTIVEDNRSLLVTNLSTPFFDAIGADRPTIVISTDSNQDALLRSMNYKYTIYNENQSRLIDKCKEYLENAINQMTNDGIFSDTGSDYLCRYKLELYNNFYTQISDIVTKWIPTMKICPYCCDLDSSLMHRSKTWNMFRCSKCGLIYTIPFFKEENIYVDNYFTEEYKHLYGKTYEEDRENIRNFAKVRLKFIKDYVKGGKLLDFGSGLGFFAEYAAENGFDVKCVDISDYAVKYITDKLKLNAEKGDAKYFENTSEKYDVISSFYVIEHVKEFEKLVFMMYNHLSDGGVLALSTPNADGVSIKKNFDKYADNHPNDHYRIFSPKFMKKLLRKYGFRHIKVNITGIHPDRMLKNKSMLNNKFMIFMTKLFAKVFGLGDTFEIYAQK